MTHLERIEEFLMGFCDGFGVDHDEKVDFGLWYWLGRQELSDMPRSEISAIARELAEAAVCSTSIAQRFLEKKYESS